MSRYRPPQPKSTAYVTAEGYAQLEAELRGLWKKRASVTQALSAAAAEGDRSENAEYIYRKKELAGIDRRIRYLQRRLPSLTVVRQIQNTTQIFFSAWVTLENEAGEDKEYRLVGPDEIDSDTSKGYISIDSPLARVLLKKQCDDEVSVQICGQQVNYIIKQIRY